MATRLFSGWRSALLSTVQATEAGGCSDTHRHAEATERSAMLTLFCCRNLSVRFPSVLQHPSEPRAASDRACMVKFRRTALGTHPPHTFSHHPSARTRSQRAPCAAVFGKPSISMLQARNQRALLTAATREALTHTAFKTSLHS